jgi:hypothetical protein
MHLPMGQYRYDTFHLNEGSVVHVRAEILHPPKHSDDGPGATNIYILQGYHTLQELEAKRQNSDVAGLEDFRGRSVWKRYVGYSEVTELEYAVPASDYYTVVYDNAAPGHTTTHLEVTVTVQMATHYLPQYARPICSARDTTVPNGCAWVFTNDQDRQRVASTCIVVKAVSPPQQDPSDNTMATTSTQDEAAATAEDVTTDDDDNDNPSTTKQDSSGIASDASRPTVVDVDIDDSQTVIVQVDAPIGSARLVLLALLPIMVGAVLWFLENGQKCIHHRPRPSRDHSSTGNTAMASSSVNERMPLKGSNNWA